MSNQSTDQYITLISSLPSAEGLFKSKLPPLSRITLEKRLNELTPTHKAHLKLVEDMLDWRLMKSEIISKQLLDQGKTVFQTLHNTTLKKIIQERLEIRTLILAMRMKHLGLSLPHAAPWGYGRWQKHIARHWNEPAFQLSNVFNWALKAEKLLQQNEPLKLETLLLDVAFRQLQRHDCNHNFDFEAVVIYVLKWNIINRTTQYNSYQAAQRFNQITGQIASAFYAFQVSTN